MSRVLTVGETMALLDPVGDGEPEHGSALTLRIGGAESNFAIALCRLRVPVTWVSRVGEDPLGRMLVGALHDEHIDVRVRVEPRHPTGLFLKWRGDDGPANLYFRRGSAASLLGAKDVPDELLDGVELVHLTGITTALGDGPRALVHDLAAHAKARGARDSFDPNYRPALGESPADAFAAHAELLPLVDWYLCGAEEGRLLFEVETPSEVLAAAHARGAAETVVRVGAAGALTEEGLVPPPRVVPVRDEIGAGDGIDDGVPCGRPGGWGMTDAVRAGHCVAASVLHATSDWETYPTAAELQAALSA